MMKRLLILLSILCSQFGFVFSQHPKTVTDMNRDLNYRDEAQNLVKGLRKKEIKDERVLAAIEKIPRHKFVSEELSHMAYVDKALPIDKEQTISQPYTVAFQTELLDLQPDDKVLEIGTGSGYQAAVLCEIGVEVYSIERHKQLHLQAQELLSQLGYHPKLFYGDGYEGLPDDAPFDKILITAAVKKIPQKLLEQLKVGGLLVAPLGDSRQQVMTIIKRKESDIYEKTENGIFVFVPMIEGVEE